MNTVLKKRTHPRDPVSEPLTERRPISDGGTPLWAQVKSSLIEMIADGRMEPRSKLPSETELCAKFNVSRTVVREALKQLVFERLVYKHQGKGSFVAERRDEQDFIGSTVGFSDELMGKNKLVTRHVIRQEVALPTSRARKLLRLERDERVVMIDRVMLVDGEPRTLVRISLRQSAVPGLEALPLEKRSLYETLRRQYGISLKRAERWIEAYTPTHEEAQLLQVAPNTPLVSIESCSYGDGDDPLEYFVAIYRTDRARLHFVIK
ncbi:GntR family transcriptional regulator [Phyllobacterium lublinensis]|uniref:GntR family transcriptional regulator n=1 Tax=Phyllobacterium lublinensis TaxID=2875708 RepID=UPI001CCEABE8|nr:GntR family transcriptional regulator [Phyllobacterium sp. 2063]MBZ9655259.1 GntR family transcriptional regulator [Phyllobacterium sp. 2063]